MSLRLEGLKKVFSDGKRQAGVHEVSLAINAGEGFSLLGPSGCGKTTTLRMIAGFEAPQAGKIFFKDRDITGLGPRARPVRTVFQRYALFPHLDVQDNIGFGLAMQKVPSQQIASRVNTFLDLIEIKHLRNRRIQTLSGGEQQRVALARALITEPAVLLLDEPLSALDLKLREKMQLELLSLRKRLGTTFIFVTHDQGEAMVLSDRIGVMNKGRLEQVGTPIEIYSKPKTKFVASFIGQANFLGLEQLKHVRFGSLAALPKDFMISENQEWMLRPEILRLAPKNAGSEAEFKMPVIVAEAAFLGQYFLVKVVDPTKAEHLVKISGASHGTNQQIAAVGASLDLCWRREDVWIVDSAHSS